MVLFFFIFYSCCPTKDIENLTGKYYNESYGTRHNLIIQEDSSFDYYIKEGMLIDTIHGGWTTAGCKAIILKKRKKNFCKGFLKSYRCDTCNQLIFKTYSAAEETALHPTYELYKKGKVIKKDFSNNNMIKINNVEVDSIKFTHLGYKPYIFRIDTITQHNLVKIYMVNDKLEYDFGQTQKWKLKSNSLINPRGLIFKPPK